MFPRAVEAAKPAGQRSGRIRSIGAPWAAQSGDLEEGSARGQLSAYRGSTPARRSGEHAPAPGLQAQPQPSEQHSCWSPRVGSGPRRAGGVCPGPDGEWARWAAEGLSQGLGCGWAFPREWPPGSPAKSGGRGGVLGAAPEGPGLPPRVPRTEHRVLESEETPRPGFAVAPTLPLRPELPSAPPPRDAGVASGPLAAVHTTGPAALVFAWAGTLQVDSFLFVFKT